VGKHEELKMFYEVVRFFACNSGCHHELVLVLALRQRLRAGSWEAVAAEAAGCGG
jgi:hypothetical protein